MKTWMFYSFKGGSGRTVAAANVAASLAKAGKRVLIVDMDIEGAGLHNVFQVENTKPYHERLGIQDYLKGTMDINELAEEVVIDLGNDPDLIFPLPIPEGAALYYLMATQNIVDVLSEESVIRAKMDALKRRFSEIYNLDHIILDSASGLGETYTISLDACDEKIIFFRWTRQHLAGTLNIIDLMEITREMEPPSFRKYRLVPSAVPSEDELEPLSEIVKKSLRAAKKNAVSSIKEALKLEEYEDPFFAEIPEYVEMKWDEKVIVFEQRPETAYDLMARKMSQSGR